MKNLQVFTSTLITMFFCCMLSAQCPVGSISFTSQQAIDDFAVNYPNCTEIESSLVISSPSITDLTPLNSITSVNGDVVIYTNNSLGSLSGLENIETISGNLHIGTPPNVSSIDANNYGNPALTDLSGLDGLRFVGGNLEISGNSNLLNLNGLSNLETVEGSLTIGRIYFMAMGYDSEFYILSNDNLTNLNGLANLNHVGAAVQIVANPALNNLEGLGGLSVINGDFNFYANDNITNFAGLNFTSINGDFNLHEAYFICEWDNSANEFVCTLYHYSNDALLNFEGMESLTNIGGSLLAVRNNALVNLSGLENLANIGQDLQITHNDDLASLTDISNMTHIGRDLQVIDNDLLADFSGLEGLITIGGNFDCYDNEILSSFTGLDNLTSIGGSLVAGRRHIYTFFAGLGIGFSYVDEGNNAMTDFSGLESLTHVGGTLTIGNNDALSSLSGLDNLSTLGGLLFYENKNITDFDGLNQVDSITGDVFIGRVYDRFFSDVGGNLQQEIFSEGNDALVDISGLNNLNHVGGNFNIADNQSLVSFMGLSSLQSIDGDFNFHNNNQAPDLAGLSGLTTIGGNFDLTYRHRYDDFLFTIYESNYALTTLTGLENLSSINGYIYIQKNIALTGLDGLASLDYSSITELTLVENSNLSVCSVPFVCAYLENGGLHTIENNASGCDTQAEVENNCGVTTLPCPEGDVSLTTQQEINDFAAQYPNCTEISGDLRIGGTNDMFTVLTDLSPLSQLTSIQGKLTIVKNDLLTNLSGLENLTMIGDDIHLGSNPSLSGLVNWNNLTSIGGSIIVRNNALSDLTGFNNLTSIGRYINIGPSMTLTSLTGLESLTTINGRISVHDNPQLNNLNGLDNIDYTTITELIILNNPQLSICDVPSICSYLQNSGTANIDNNAYGCNTQTQVQNACNPMPPDNPCGGAPSTDSLTHVFDQDLFIDGVGFANNPNITFTDPATPADAVLSDISLELYFRLNGNTCENEIAIQLTDPAGNTQALTAFTSCDGGNGLYYVNLNIPSGNTTGSTADWLVEFDDTNDQNSGYEYSVRFARLNYVATTSGSGGTPIVNEVSDYADMDLFIDGTGFANNGTYIFTDPATPADAVLSDISLELYFRLNGNTCENEIAIQITDPAGNTQALTAFTTCDGGNGLYYVNLDVPSGNTTGSTANWTVQFDDTNDQNSGYEYSVRFGRLTYTTTYTEVGGGMPVTVNETVSEYVDWDLYIVTADFVDNSRYTFTDPATPADAVLSDISLELYFRLNGNSCENEIAIQITDPAGNTQALTPFTTCNGGNGLYYINLNVPSGNTTGNVADWVVEFKDTNEQNIDYEYSVRFGRLTYNTEYTECMPMKNEENTSAQQLNNSSTQQLANSSAHEIVSTSARQHISTLKLYPVPASQYLNVEYFSENINSTNIEIISNEGKMLRSKQQLLQEGLNTIQMNTADLPAGRYHLRIYNADDVQVQSFVKI